ncbi:flagellar basal body rod protein FlgC [Desulfovibrio litoralis]|uniref:Flagellar basal-body rod protein FlgC n=1 Tax=Desulfovibrio litoralis DSM 11393 TaxID=1121455 RepID=A0A1M7SDG9_9BACT|nr:flagellar basal body rod protein FlgC [Desulfovibrio litoralis]SHN56523.1 flagellar basal-body rod protein FlgC [Desulfovibrio litoralis DSM 11393]
MDFMTALDIGASALSADRTYLNIISMNLANVKTTRTAEGGPYRRKSVVMAATDVDSSFSRQMQSALDRELKGVRVMDIVADKRPEKEIYEPGHPDANQDGIVKYPDINVVEEMAHMMTVQRNYEANVATMDTVKAMYNKALEIGR